MKRLAENLKYYARKAGLSDAAVARKSGLSEVRYGHYVRGRSEPDLATLIRICNVLNITPNDLLLADEGKNRALAKDVKPDDERTLQNRIITNVKRLGRRRLTLLNKMLNAFMEDS
jgi:transcriptional regulator with XRE-family HTH domain